MGRRAFLETFDSEAKTAHFFEKTAVFTLEDVSVSFAIKVGPIVNLRLRKLPVNLLVLQSCCPLSGSRILASADSDSLVLVFSDYLVMR